MPGVTASTIAWRASATTRPARMSPSSSSWLSMVMPQAYRQSQAHRPGGIGSRLARRDRRLLGDPGTRWPDLRASPPVPRLPGGPPVATVGLYGPPGMAPLAPHQRAQDTFAHVL